MVGSVQSPARSEFEAFHSARYFRAVDGLRAISVLLVVFNHVRGHDTWRWISGSTNGVTIFFVISGFLITTLCLREERSSGSVDVRGFLVRRGFRILPLYLLVLAVYWLLTTGLDVDPERSAAFHEHALWYLTPFPEVPHFSSDPGVPFEVAWSLGLEEKFYLVWPILGFVVLRARDRARATVVVALIVGALIAPLLLGTLGVVIYEYAHILAGCLVALALDDRRTFAFLRPLGRPRVVVAVLVVLIVLHALRALIPNPLNFAFSLATAAALVGLLLHPGSAAGRLLQTRPMVVIGRLSYALYLTHQLGLNVAERIVPESLGTTGDALTVPVALVLILPACWVLHRMVEAPLIDIGRRLTRGPAALRAPAA